MNVTVPVPGVNVPRLDQLPAMAISLLLALLNVTPAGMVMLPFKIRSVAVMVMVPAPEKLRLL